MIINCDTLQTQPERHDCFNVIEGEHTYYNDCNGD